MQTEYGEGQDGRLEQLLNGAGMELNAMVRPVVTKVAVTRFDAFLVADVQTRPATLTWRRRDPAAQRRFLYLFVERGTVAFSGEGTVHRSRSGRLGIIEPGADEVVIEAATDADAVIFMFDHDELGSTGIGPLSDAGVGLAEDSPIVRAAFSYLRGVAQRGKLDAGVSAPKLRGLTREISLVLTSSSYVTDSFVLQDAFELAMALIVSRSSQPQLDPARLAGAVGVSLRTLQRQFAERGFHVARQIRVARAQRARRLLADRPQLSTTEVAAASGFGSVDSMRRTIRDEFGTLPTDIRDEAAG